MSRKLSFRGMLAVMAAVVALSSGYFGVSFAQEGEGERRDEKGRPEARGREEEERGERGERGDRGLRERQAVELRERLGQLERQIKELRDAGKLDAAADRVREFKQLQEKLAALRGGERREREGRELPGEVRERLEQLKRRHAELREAGKQEEAQAVEREARQLMERYGAAQRHGEVRDGGEQRELPGEVRERLEQLKRQHAELREAGKQEEAQAVEREAKALLERFTNARRDGEPRKGERREGGERGENEAAQKLRHLRAAVEHLRAAGLNELAERAAQQISRFERELGQPREGERREGEARERSEGERREAESRERERGEQRDRKERREREERPGGDEK